MKDEFLQLKSYDNLWGGGSWNI